MQPTDPHSPTASADASKALEPCGRGALSRAGERATRAMHRTRRGARRLASEVGQGTVEYVGLVLLVAVLIAGVVKASGGFSDTGIADAVVKKIKGAIAGVGE